jgi:hypothetical protein
MIQIDAVKKLVLMLGCIVPLTLYGQKEPSLYRRAPDVLPGTLPEMRTPEFWIDRTENPDQVILSVAEIQRMNRAYQEKMKNLSTLEQGLEKEIKEQLESWTGLIAVPPDLASLSQNELNHVVKEMIQSQIRYMRKKNFGNILGVSYADWEIDVFEESMGLNSVGEMKGIQQGITVHDSRIRIVPTIRPEHVAIENSGRARWDMFNLDILPIGRPVQILHASKNSEYMFVLTERGFGWINSENIAITEQKLIAKSISDKGFIVCTGERVPYYSDSTCKYLSGWLRMGDRLNYSNGNNQFEIAIPFRNSDARLTLAKAWLTKDADVHVGFLPYTKRNILKQTFKLLDQVYDYTGAWFGRNHATILRDLFSCFGFAIPGNGVLLKAYNYSGSTRPDVGKERQYKSIMENESCTTIQISGGHSQLYIGEYKGIPHVFDTHGYGYTDENGKEHVIRRSCIYTPELPDYMLKKEIVFVELQ